MRRFSVHLHLTGHHIQHLNHLQQTHHYNFHNTFKTGCTNNSFITETYVTHRLLKPNVKNFSKFYKNCIQLRFRRRCQWAGWWMTASSAAELFSWQRSNFSIKAWTFSENSFSCQCWKLVLVHLYLQHNKLSRRRLSRAMKSKAEGTQSCTNI